MTKVLKVEWELPESLYDDVVDDELTAAEDAKRALVPDWVRTKRISLRRGAEFPGLTCRDFLDLMAAHRVPSMDDEEGWFDREVGVRDRDAE
ncbi:MAG: hypothetical protein A3J75_05535 [Acidobacteria bacterium RBG_16_68_9]|nr:MAG: hypothetical protein A3J75_05535 [Acidobacteria bacterium RBG_16_68_9]